MTTTRPFRFGVLGGAPDAASWLAMARRTEELGYAVLHNSDHLDMSGVQFSMFSPFPALTAAAAVTSDIRLGTCVLNSDMRHPAVLAQEITSLDALSGGRFELGLGCGWAEYEYDWAGIPFEQGSIRIARLAEYVQVLKALMEKEVASFDGEYFTITDMPGLPRPTQSPRPKFMLGGTFKRMLSLAAREAEIVNVLHTTQGAGTADKMDRRIEWIQEAAGSRFDQIELSTTIGHVLVTDTARDVALTEYYALLSDNHRAGLSVEDFVDAPISLVGPVESICEQLEDWRERWGYSYVIVTHHNMEQFAPVVELMSGR